MSFIRLMSVLLIQFLLFCWWGPVAIADEKLHAFRIATGEYEPYTSKSLPDYGIDSYIVAEAFREEGIVVEFSFFPWKRAFKNAKSGAFHGTVPWAIREDRREFFYYSDPIIEVDQEYFYYLNSTTINWNPNITDYSQLQGMSIIAGAGYNFGPKFQEAEANKTITVYRSQDLENSIKMLLNGRSDIIISKQRVADFAMRDHFTKEQIASINKQVVSSTSPGYDYLLISKLAANAPQYLEAFNRGLQQLHSTGKYNELILEFSDGKYSAK